MWLRSPPQGLYVPLDAAETSSKFMVDGWPSEPRFNTVIGDLIERVAARGQRCLVRVFGEMVALLWNEGNARGAVRLEDLWNDLAKKIPFTLLCAYPLKTFPKTLTLARTNRWHCPLGAHLSRHIRDAAGLRVSIGPVASRTSHCLLWSSGSGAGTGVTSPICRSTRSITRRIVSNGMPLSGSVTATFVGMSNPNSRDLLEGRALDPKRQRLLLVLPGLKLGRPR
jgi:hypothetical protein